MRSSAKSRCERRLGSTRRTESLRRLSAAPRLALEKRIKEAAGGNPGLQAILQRPLLKGEIEAAERAVAAVESYLQTGKVPEEKSAANEFFKRVSLRALADLLTPGEREQLRAAKLFEIPVPKAALEAAGAALSVPEPAAAIDRLQGLGLFDFYRQPRTDVEEFAANPLARPLVAALGEEEGIRLARHAVGPLYAAWKDADGELPRDIARMAGRSTGPDRRSPSRTF